MSEEMEASRRELVLRAYAAFNARDVKTLLACVADDVDWPDEERRIHGKKALRAYWIEQWTRTRTHDEPVELGALDGGGVAVHVDQVVRSLDGAVLSQGRFLHTIRIEDGLISCLDIGTVSADSASVSDAGKGTTLR